MKQDQKITFNRAEHKTGILDIFRSWGQVLGTIFSKQEDNDMLDDLAVKKGIKNGFRYFLFFMFVLPARVLAFVLDPKWSWVRFVQKYLVTPFFEIEAIGGEYSPSKILSENYERILNHIVTKNRTGITIETLKPEMVYLERVIIFSKLRMMVTMFVFLFASFYVFSFFYGYVAAIADVTQVGSLFVGGSMYASDIGNLFDVLGGSVLVRVVIIVLAVSLMMYMIAFAYRFFVEGWKALFTTKGDMIKDFIDDTIYYTIDKSIELYGEDTAYTAYDILLENFVLQGSIDTKPQATTMKPQYIKMIEYRNRIDDDELEVLGDDE